jgi:hypothetical protein
MDIWGPKTYYQVRRNSNNVICRSHLIPRKYIEINAQLLYIYTSVGCVSHTIHTYHSSWDSVYFLRNGFNVVNGAKNVACVRTSYQPRPLRKQCAQILWIQLRAMSIQGSTFVSWSICDRIISSPAVNFNPRERFLRICVADAPNTFQQKSMSVLRATAGIRLEVSYQPRRSLH